MAGGLNLGTAIAYLTLDMSGFERGFSNAERAMQGFSAQGATTADKFHAVGSSMSSVGDSLTRNVTVPIVGIGSQMMKTGIDFEFAMSQVETTVKNKAGFTKEKFKDLETAARDMGKQTSFTAVEAANALQYMGMAGWGIEDMLQGLQPIMNLAIAGNTDLALTSDIVTDALTAFGLEASDAGHFCDILAQAAMFSNTNVGMMGESFHYAAGTAASMGFTAEDTAVALGLMANSGIKSSMAGTSLRSVMTNLAAPVGKAKEAVEKLDLNLVHADGSTKSFKEMMDELRNKIGAIQVPTEEVQARITALDEAYQSGSISEEEYNAQLVALTESVYGKDKADKVALASMLAGKTGMAGLIAILSASQEDYEDLTGAIYGATDETTKYSAANDMAATAQKNTKTDIDKLKSSWDDFSISLYQLIAGPLSDFIKSLTEVIDWLNSLDDETKENIIKFFAFAAAVGPIISLFGNVVSIVGTVINIFGGLGKIVQVVAGVFGIGEGGAGLLGVLKTLGSFLIGPLKAVFGAVAGALGGIPAVVLAVVAAVGGGLVLLYKHNEKFRNFVDGLVGKVKDFVKAIPEVLGDFWDWFKGALGKAKDKIVEWGGNIKEHAGDISTGFKKGLEIGFLGVPVFIGKQLGKALTHTKKFKEDMGKEGKEASKKFEKGIDSLDSIGSKIAKILGKGLGIIKGWRKDMTDEAEKTAQEMVDKHEKELQPLEPKTRTQFAIVKEIAKKHGVEMAEVAKNTGGKYTEEYEEELKKTKDKTKEKLDDTLEVAEDFKEDMSEEGKETGEQHKDSLLGSMDGLDTGVQQKYDQAEKITETFTTKFQDRGEVTGKKFVERFMIGMNGLPREISKLFEQVRQSMLPMASMMIPVGQNFMQGFMVGIRQVGDQIMAYMNNLVNHIAQSTQSASQNMRNISANINPRAVGVDYVPYNGYGATLHEGEMVLTKEEAERYRKGLGRDGTGSGDTFIFNSPKAVDEREAARLLKETKRRLQLGF